VKERDVSNETEIIRDMMRHLIREKDVSNETSLSVSQDTVTRVVTTQSQSCETPLPRKQGEPVSNEIYLCFARHSHSVSSRHSHSLAKDLLRERERASERKCMCARAKECCESEGVPHDSCERGTSLLKDLVRVFCKRAIGSSLARHSHSLSCWRCLATDMRQEESCGTPSLS